MVYDPVKRKIYRDKYNTDNKEKIKDYNANRREYRKQHAIDSIKSGSIIDQHEWDVWCNGTIKSRAKINKKPYSDDFTNEKIFDMMTRGCSYCGDIATTIDRIDSSLGHTQSNCVASCLGCNFSKGTSDSATFVRKAYFRINGEYVDGDTKIWFVIKQKPRLDTYKKRADKIGVRFGLTKGDWETLIKGDCAYCHRSPTTWFGIDRIVPSNGYVLDNVVTCCCDCNTDKYEDDVDTMMERNERIATRVTSGELVITNSDKVILHRGTHKSSKKVCVYGKVYQNQSEASRALGKGGNYVCQCIRDVRHSDEIFEISDEFYDFLINTRLENITKTMYLLFNRM